MFPHGGGAFAAANYPNLGQELAPLGNLVNSTLNLEELTNRINPDVNPPPTAPPGTLSSVKAFGLTGAGKYVIWLFDDDFNTTWGVDWGKSNRTYMNDQKDSKHDHVLVIPSAAKASYTVTRYNTWTGAATVDPNPIVRGPDGKLSIPIGQFSTDTNHPGKTWDGADVLLIVE